MRHRHHYEFAHVALRQVCQSNPMRFFEVLASGQDSDLIGPVWAAVCEHCDIDHDTSIEAADIRVHRIRVSNYPAAVIELPAPEQPHDAFFVAVVLLSNPTEKLAPSAVRFRYFTLVRGDDPAAPTTHLWEWQGHEKMNRGVGPQPDLKRFANAVDAEMARS